MHRDDRVAAGLANLDEILAVPGIDAILVGPSDLGIDLGVGPQPNPLAGSHADALRTIARRCAAAGIVAMSYAVSVAGVAMFRDLGYEVFGVSSDAALLRGAALALVETSAPTTPDPATTRRAARCHRSRFPTAPPRRT